MKFSERMGIVQPKTAMQTDSMDSALRNSLWNVLYRYYVEKIPSRSKPVSYYYVLGSVDVLIAEAVWKKYLKEPVDKCPKTPRDFEHWLRGHFFVCQWNEVYDFLEFFWECTKHSPWLFNRDNFAQSINSVLEQERAGYRMVDGVFIPITNNAEWKEVEDALAKTADDPFAGAHEHLDQAVTLFSDRKKPDFRNSIKESISAVESIAKVIAKKEKATLGDALDALSSCRVDLHGALKEGFKKLYGYTSDEGGIRHALMEESNLNFDDAKYMLVSCSAFVNYLIAKSVKAGIEPK